MTDMAARARRYTCFITVKTRNFYIPPGILKFRVYELFGSMNFEYTHFRFYTTLPQLYAKYDIPHKVVQNIIEDVTNFLQSSAFKFVRDEVSELLIDSGLDAEWARKLYGMFENLENPFVGLQSKWRRLETYKKSVDFIAPIAITIVNDVEAKAKNNKNSMVPVKVEMEYVPMTPVLKRFQEMSTILPRTKVYLDLLQCQSKNVNVVSNFIQAELWQRIQTNFKDKFVLPIFIYFDEYDANNCLGSHAGSTGKMGGVYMGLPSLPLEFQGKLQNIFLGQIFQSAD